MSIIDNIERIEQGKTSIITTIKSKGVNIPNGVLINEIAPYINEIQSGGGVPTDTDTYNRLNFTNISGIDGTLTIQDKVDISNMEYSMDSYTFSKVKEREFNFPKNATIYLKWEGDCNLNKGGESNFFTTNIDTMVSGILRNGDIDRAYRGLFYGVGTIKDVSNLIFRSEYLGEQSIASAFRETGITKTPTIEATKFGVACFDACYMHIRSPLLRIVRVEGHRFGCSTGTHIGKLPDQPFLQLYGRDDGFGGIENFARQRRFV